jgi:hypothetical protein
MQPPSTHTYHPERRTLARTTHAAAGRVTQSTCERWACAAQRHQPINQPSTSFSCSQKRVQQLRARSCGFRPLHNTPSGRGRQNLRRGGLWADRGLHWVISALEPTLPAPAVARNHIFQRFASSDSKVSQHGNPSRAPVPHGDGVSLGQSALTPAPTQRAEGFAACAPCWGPGAKDSGLHEFGGCAARTLLCRPSTVPHRPLGGAPRS